MYSAYVYIVVLFYKKRTSFLIAYRLLRFLHVTSSFDRSTLLSQVRTNGSATNHSHFSMRNAAFVVSRLILSGVSPKPYARTMESHDTRIRINVGTLSRSRSTSSGRKRESRENSWTKRNEIGRREMRGMRRERRDEACEGEGDAMRLINRHADNHSGFMVTTDYQVVQGGIFHIRDVTLFQWGNTCSARYKLHERAYTVRHVCCIASVS